MSVSWAELSAAIQANPNKAKALSARRAAVAASAILPTLTTVPWLSGWSEDTTCTVPDVVSFVLWVRDPMYRAATPAARRTMEMELAQELLLHLDTNWHTKGGRGRGWVRKHIEEDLQLRAGGGAPKEDFWSSLATTKRVSLLTDYVLIVSEMRAIIWWPTRAVTVIPSTGGSAAAIVAQVNADTGRMLVGEKGGRVDGRVDTLIEGRMTWMSPAHLTAGSQKVSDITAAIAALGKTAKAKGKSELWAELQWHRMVAGAGVLDDVV